MTAYDTIFNGIKTKLETITGLTVYLNYDHTNPVNIYPTVDIQAGEDDPYAGGGTFGGRIHKVGVRIAHWEQSGANPDTSAAKLSALETSIITKMNEFRDEMIANFTIEDMSEPTRSPPINNRGDTLFIAGVLAYEIWYITKIYGETR